MLRSWIFAAAVLMTLNACGDDDDDDSTPSDASSDSRSDGGDAAVRGTAVDVTMADYMFTLSRSSVPAGTVTFTATNNGTHPHEMVIVQTDLPPAMLPTAMDGSVDEEMLDVADEIEEIEPGSSDTLTLDLDAGTYVLFCNVDDHYSRGMYIAFTVTGG